MDLEWFNLTESDDGHCNVDLEMFQWAEHWPGFDVFEGLWDSSLAVLDAMTFITHDEVRARADQGLMYTYRQKNTVTELNPQA